MHLFDLAVLHQAPMQGVFLCTCNCSRGACSALHAELGGTHALLRLALPHEALLHADGLRLHSDTSISEAAVWVQLQNESGRSWCYSTGNRWLAPLLSLVAVSLSAGACPKLQSCCLTSPLMHGMRTLCCCALGPQRTRKRMQDISKLHSQSHACASWQLKWSDSPWGLPAEGVPQPGASPPQRSSQRGGAPGWWCGAPAHSTCTRRAVIMMLSSMRMHAGIMMIIHDDANFGAMTWQQTCAAKPAGITACF